MKNNDQINILTFDIEEWFHFDTITDEDKWETYPARIDIFLSPILDKLDEYNIKATFFCLGWVARTYPDVIKKIYNRGHEVATHGDRHYFVREMTPEVFDADLKISLDSIQNLIGEKITAFRAPAFSISEDSKWAFEVLAENGIKNDCSIFPATRSYGGFPSFGTCEPTIIRYKDAQIMEFPITTAKVLGKQFVFAGGGYFRLFPYPLIKSLMKKADYNMTYLHMRDFDYDQPRGIKPLSALGNFKTYYGIKGAYPKFLKMLDNFTWCSLGQAQARLDPSNIKILELK